MDDVRHVLPAVLLPDLHRAVDEIDPIPGQREDLPLASSEMSGFFFCGMMLDPVE